MGTNTRRSAFWQGFFDGLAAPVRLFSLPEYALVPPAPTP